MRRRTLTLLPCALAVPAVTQAQVNWPQRPIRLIVPWPAGGQADFLGRHVALVMARDLGQTIFVENKPGAGSNIGSDLVAKAAPDGYTLLLVGSANAANMALYPKVPYDALRDFAPISVLASAATALVVSTQVNAKTVNELINLARKEPDVYAFGSPGIGSPGHLAGEHFARMAGIRLRHVPYQGAPAAVTDVMAGRIPIAFVNIDASLGQIQAGMIRALAVTPSVRASLLPDVRTISESGLPGYEWSSWLGLVAPAGTPPEVTARLQRSLTAVRDPGSLETIRKHGLEPVLSTAEEMKSRLQQDVGRFAKLVKDAGIKVE